MVNLNNEIMEYYRNHDDWKLSSSPDKDDYQDEEYSKEDYLLDNYDRHE